jgi:hypothetical protein
MAEYIKQKSGKTNAYYYNNLALSDPNHLLLNRPQATVVSSVKTDLTHGQTTQLSLTQHVENASVDPVHYTPVVVAKPNTVTYTNLYVSSNEPSKTLSRSVAASYTPVSFRGGSGIYVFTLSPSLPTGLSMNGTTGLVSGTPTVVSGTKTYTVTVNDTDAGKKLSATFQLKVL